jgi:hypothetical protein
MPFSVRALCTSLTASDASAAAKFSEGAIAAPLAAPLLFSAAVKCLQKTM